MFKNYFWVLDLSGTYVNRIRLLKHTKCIVICNEYIFILNIALNNKIEGKNIMKKNVFVLLIWTLNFCLVNRRLK